MKKFSAIYRKQYIQELQNGEFDLVIVGGGINGAGVAREAAQRGMKVALVEASDFASGTSSKSSKLIHGGIRYLENMDFKLVFEALNERTKLFNLAPHLVHPLRFMLPLYKSSRVGMGLMGLGMWLYDALSLFQAPQLHERLSAKETVARMPDIKESELVGSYVYSDAYMDDDRLVHETLRSAVDEGAVCVSFIKALKIEFTHDQKFQGLEVEDLFSKNKFRIRGKHLISAAGPWTDFVRKDLLLQKDQILRPTKGIHLTFKKGRLPLTSAVVMAAEKSDRIVFGIPRHEMIIVGTTDTDYKDNPSNVAVTSDDVDYLLQITNDYFPGAKLTRADIVSSYVGVRPLVKDGSNSEGKTSREHTILQYPEGVTLVAGGKYTTYRLMCQQVVEKALLAFPIEKRVEFKNSRSVEPLNKWTSPEVYADALAQDPSSIKSSNLSAAEVSLLIERYGAEAFEMMRSNSQMSYLELEAFQAIHTTSCYNLVDFYTRRVPLYLSEVDHGLRYAKVISRIFAEELHWSESQTQEQLKQLEQFIQTDLSWKTALR